MFDCDPMKPLGAKARSMLELIRIVGEGDGQGGLVGNENGQRRIEADVGGLGGKALHLGIFA